MKPIDPKLKAFTPEVICKLQRPDRFWLAVLKMHYATGMSLEKSYIELEEIYHSYCDMYRYSNIRAARTGYKRFLAKAKERNKLILNSGTDNDKFAL